MSSIALSHVPVRPPALPRNGDAIEMIRIPRAAHTLAGFRTWAKTLPDRAKITFLSGEVFVDMSNEDLERHVKVKGVIFATLFQLMEAADLGEIYQDGGLVTNVSADLANNPDAFAVLWESLESGRAKMIEKGGRFAELEGTPDWVLEVVSPSSVFKDTRLLRQGYHAAGIPEYWLVDARSEPLSFTILQWRKSGYVAAANKSGWQWSKIFDRNFQLRLEFRRGRHKFVLDSAGK